MNRTRNLAAALELASKGWKVFPCRHVTVGEYQAKSPMTKNRHLNATTDADQIRAWWGRWPYALIGAVVPDTMIVVDIDPRNGGSVEALGNLPPTLTAWSGRNDGGRHLYFMRPAGETTSTRLPVGVDLKKNGYCIVPPSIHPTTGQPYRWEHQPVALLPYTLLELLRPAPRPVRVFTGSTKNGSGLLRKVAEAEEGRRHDVLVWAAFRALDDGILDQISDDLVAASVSAGETEISARRTVASVRRTSS